MRLSDTVFASAGGEGGDFPLPTEAENDGTSEVPSVYYSGRGTHAHDWKGRDRLQFRRLLCEMFPKYPAVAEGERPLRFDAYAKKPVHKKDIIVKRADGSAVTQHCYTPLYNFQQGTPGQTPIELVYHAQAQFRLQVSHKLSQIATNVTNCHDLCSHLIFLLFLFDWPLLWLCIQHGLNINRIFLADQIGTRIAEVRRPPKSRSKKQDVDQDDDDADDQGRDASGDDDEASEGASSPKRKKQKKTAGSGSSSKKSAAAGSGRKRRATTAAADSEEEESKSAAADDEGDDEDGDAKMASPEKKAKSRGRGRRRSRSRSESPAFSGLHLPGSGSSGKGAAAAAAAGGTKGKQTPAGEKKGKDTIGKLPGRLETMFGQVALKKAAAAATHSSSDVVISAHSKEITPHEWIGLRKTKFITTVDYQKEVDQVMSQVTRSSARPQNCSMTHLSQIVCDCVYLITLCLLLTIVLSRSRHPPTSSSVRSSSSSTR